MQLPDLDKLIERIIQLKAESGLLEEELAKSMDMSQSTVSKILHKERELKYEEAKKLVDYLEGVLSSIPKGEITEKIATMEDEMKPVYEDSDLADVAQKMYENGFSQMPVRSREDNSIVGLITEMSLLNVLLSPHMSLNGLKVKDVTLESPPIYSHDTPLITIAKVLLDYYAVLIERNGKVAGIITRADMLKLF